MYNEGAPDFVVDQGMYYPAATNYAYYCTGFESPGEWENHQMIFGVDGSDVQHSGGQIENSPYICYTPTYGYAQSPYNPYNPYIPGATIGVDGQVIGSQQYYSVPPYQSSVSSPTYIPFVLQPDMNPNSSSDPLLESGAYIASRSDGRGSKHKLASAAAAFPRNITKPLTSEANAFSRNSERSRTNTSQSKQPAVHGGVSSTGFPAPASTRVFQGKTASVAAQAVDDVPTGRFVRGQLEVASPLTNGFSEFGSNSYAAVKFRPKIYSGRCVNDSTGNAAAIAEQNRGPRTKRSKNQLVVKAYTTKAGDGDALGNIVIDPDQYNKDDFRVEYVDARFFVIKSYSEDDVHKSIKYDVWSSTPHGNKKLQSAYEEAQKIASERSTGCPIFLFFSVNASGLFCGVAEMVGPVDFNKDMDFWQQDKWSGSFPVKWHIIKDVPNGNFRHIILENNENKPVTNSRDTQEIMRKQGLEMLKIFKEYMAKTSLLDDFMYYENRQRIMQEEKGRFLYKTFQSPFLVPQLDSSNKPNLLAEPSFNKDEKITEEKDLKSEDKDHYSLKNISTSSEEEINISSDMGDVSNTDENATEVLAESKEDITSTLKFGSLTIDPNGANPKAAVDTSVGDIVTVGSMPVKVNGSADSSPKILTVGTIPLDPRSLKP